MDSACLEQFAQPVPDQRTLTISVGDRFADLLEQPHFLAFCTFQQFFRRQPFRNPIPGRQFDNLFQIRLGAFELHLPHRPLHHLPQGEYPLRRLAEGLEITGFQASRRTEVAHFRTTGITDFLQAPGKGL